MAEPAPETGDTIVMTCRVPAGSGDDLDVSVSGHDVSVSGPDGFAHELRFPVEADMERLAAQLYRGILELRAPKSSRPAQRTVPVRTL